MNPQILKGPKLKYFIKDSTFGTFLFNQSVKYKDRICQIDGTIDKSETYSSVKLRSIRVALELQNRGITSKDIVAFCSSNTLDNTIPIIATAFLGAKIANLDPSLSVRQTTHLLSIVEPKAVFVEENALTLIEKSLSETRIECDIIVFGNSEKYTTFSSLLHKQRDEEKFIPVEVDPNDMAILFFSSGSTGLPKAICHSHKSFLKSVEKTCEVGFGEAPLHFTSFYWITAITMMLCSFADGSYRVFCRNPTAEDVFRIIEKYKVATTFAAPILSYKLTNFENSSSYDTSSLKLFALGGTPTPASQLLKLRQIFKNTFVFQCYGLSETNFSTAFLSKSDQQMALTNFETCGKPLYDSKIKVIDLSTGLPLGPNQQGEVCIWTLSVMIGYYKQDASSNFDDEGFLKTGDVGYYDENGFLYLVGRIKEMFKYQSWHIVPAFIESVLLEHPGIKEAVVFGLPHSEDGEVPAAGLVLHEGYNLQEEEIDAFLKEKVADRERLRGGVTILDAFPKTLTGKIVRGEVKNAVMKLKNIM